MGNINSGQLTCSNLDKLGVDQYSGIPVSPDRHSADHSDNIGPLS